MLVSITEKVLQGLLSLWLPDQKPPRFIPHSDPGSCEFKESNEMPANILTPTETPSARLGVAMQVAAGMYDVILARSQEAQAPQIIKAWY